MALSLTLDKFDCEGEPKSVVARWERWKRALHIYLEAANIKESQKKRANLLHFGELDLQEVFYKLPDANVEAKEGVDVFKVTLAKLIILLQNKIYERHLFRLLKQEPNEKFEKFLIRLRQQAQKCQFQYKDDHIIDQIVEKGVSTELRKKILQIGDDVNLERIIKEANSLESVTKQLEEFDSTNKTTQGVNKIVTKTENHKAARTKPQS